MSEHVSPADLLKAVKAQRVKFLSDGVSAPTFFMGVSNVALSAFLLGHVPQHYWLLNMAKSLFYFPARLLRQHQQGTLMQQVELCWVSNAMLLILLLLLWFDELVAGEVLPAHLYRPGFLIFWMLGAGPVGWSVAILQNALIFHSIDHMATLFIHTGPMLTLWGLRFSAAAVQASYPVLGAMLVDLEEVPPDPWSEMMLPALIFYILWWVPYTIFLLATLHEVKSTEVLNSAWLRWLEPQAHRLLGCLTRNSTRTVMLVYCFVHMLSCIASFISAVIVFRSFLLYTLFCFIMLLAAAWNGASRYQYYLLDVYERRLQKLIAAVSETGGQGTGRGAAGAGADKVMV